MGVCSNNLWFFQNFSFATSPIIELERYKNENNELIIGKSTSWAVMNWLSVLFIRFIRQIPVYNHNGWTYETNNRTDSALPCGLHSVRIRITEHSVTLCTFFILLLFLTSLHFFTTGKHYFALILQYGVARYLSQRFWSFQPHSL